MSGNKRCKTNCGASIKSEAVDENENWVETEDGYLCPSCNPDGLDWADD